jgi:hypothetical protein
MQALEHGILDDSEREDVLAHINDCEQCRHDWLLLSNPRHQELKQSDNGEEGHSSTYSGKVVSLQSRQKKIGWMAVVSLGLAASFLAVIFWLRSPIALMERLDDLYRLYYQEISLDGERLAKQIPVPSKDLYHMEYGFTSNADSDPALKAFNSGLWLGREDIRTNGKGPTKPLPIFLLPVDVEEKNISDDPWRNSDWAIYSNLGSWIVLLRTGCAIRSDGQSKLLREQQTIGLALMQKFSNRQESYAKPILSGLKRLSQLFDGFYKGKRASEVCRGIEEETERLIVLLSS